MQPGEGSVIVLPAQPMNFVAEWTSTAATHL